MGDYESPDRPMAAAVLYLETLENPHIPIANPRRLREQAADFESIMYDVVTDNGTPHARYLAADLQRTMARLGIPPADRPHAVRALQESMRTAVHEGKITDPQAYLSLKSTLDLMFE